jgi:subtilase family serine protease
MVSVRLRFRRFVFAGTGMVLGLLAMSAPAANARTFPDLHPGPILGAGRFVQAGSIVRLHSCVENLGDRGTGVFHVRWLVDGRNVGTFGRHRGVPGHSSVCNGNSFFFWRVPNDPGSFHTITFIVDVNNNVRESNEFNNSTSARFNVFRFR